MSAKPVSFKFLSPDEAAKLSVAEFTRYQEQLTAANAAVTEARAAKEKGMYDSLGVIIDSLKSTFGKALGGRTDVTLKEVISLVKQRDVGTLGKLTNSKAGEPAKRLSDEDKLHVRGLMLIRALAIKNKGTPKPISEIAAETGFTAQTIANYKPTQAEIDAGQLDAVAPATPATPAVVAPPAAA